MRGLRYVPAMGAFLVCVFLSGCETMEPVMYSGISSASYLKADRQDPSGRIPYRYETPFAWSSYSDVRIDPVTIYRGSDNQFGDMDEDDKRTLANFMKERFEEKLRTRQRESVAPSRATVRVKLTLTGAKKNTPVLGTFSRVDLAGGLYNGIQAIRDREGSLTGSVIYVVEIYEMPSRRLLGAYVTKQYPSPMNLPASIGPLDAAKAGIDKGAEAFVAEMKS